MLDRLSELARPLSMGASINEPRRLREGHHKASARPLDDGDWAGSRQVWGRDYENSESWLRLNGHTSCAGRLAGTAVAVPKPAGRTSRGI